MKLQVFAILQNPTAAGLIAQRDHAGALRDSTQLGDREAQMRRYPVKVKAEEDFRVAIVVYPDDGAIRKS